MEIKIDYDEVRKQCYGTFERKLMEYGASWRVMEPVSVIDQILIKVHRLKTIMYREARVSESILETLTAIVNYGVIGEIQLNMNTMPTGAFFLVDERETILTMYRETIENALELLSQKNADYGAIWLDMFPMAILDIIHTKIMRIKGMRMNGLLTDTAILNELNDIINYGIFLIIKFKQEQENERTRDSGAKYSQQH